MKKSQVVVDGEKRLFLGNRNLFFFLCLNLSQKEHKKVFNLVFDTRWNREVFQLIPFTRVSIAFKLERIKSLLSYVHTIKV